MDLRSSYLNIFKLDEPNRNHEKTKIANADKC